MKGIIVIAIISSLIFNISLANIVYSKNGTSEESPQTREELEKKIRGLEEEISEKKEGLLSTGEAVLSEFVLIGFPVCDFIISHRIPAWRFAIDLGAIAFGIFVFTDDRLKREEIAELEDEKNALTDKLVSLSLPEEKEKEEVSKEKKRRGLPPLELISFNRTYLPKDYRVGRYSDELILTLILKNNTDKTIKAWRCFLVVKNPFGAILFETRLRDNVANIEPGEIGMAPFKWEDNQFINDEPFDKLMSYENLKLELQNVQVTSR